jgi:hypothetical protein
MAGLRDLVTAAPTEPVSTEALIDAMDRLWSEVSCETAGTIYYLPAKQVSPRRVIRRRGRTFVISAEYVVDPEFIKSFEEAREYWNRP